MSWFVTGLLRAPQVKIRVPSSLSSMVQYLSWSEDRRGRALAREPGQAALPAAAGGSLKSGARASRQARRRERRHEVAQARAGAAVEHERPKRVPVLVALLGAAERDGPHGHALFPAAHGVGVRAHLRCLRRVRAVHARRADTGLDVAVHQALLRDMGGWVRGGEALGQEGWEGRQAMAARWEMQSRAMQR
eukprot:scaffold102675_cov57-Phaeocystis_antarctica.AAC.2